MPPHWVGPPAVTPPVQRCCVSGPSINLVNELTDCPPGSLIRDSSDLTPTMSDRLLDGRDGSCLGGPEAEAGLDNSLKPLQSKEPAGAPGFRNFKRMVGAGEPSVNDFNDLPCEHLRAEAASVFMSLYVATMSDSSKDKKDIK